MTDVKKFSWTQALSNMRHAHDAFVFDIEPESKEEDEARAAFIGLCREIAEIDDNVLLELVDYKEGDS